MLSKLVLLLIIIMLKKNNVLVFKKTYVRKIHKIKYEIQNYIRPIFLLQDLKTLYKTLFNS